MTLIEAAQGASQETSWIGLFIAGALGGFAAKALDIVYSTYIRHSETEKGLKEFVDTDSDPVLKAADELVGKMTSLANEDFSSLRGEPTGDLQDDATVELASLLYLLAQFWARVEILRNESLYVRLAESEQGRELSAFLRSIESRAVRITDRARQRAIGELLIREGPNHRKCMTFEEFATVYQSDERMKGWLHPLVAIVQGTARGSPSEKHRSAGAIEVRCGSPRNDRHLGS